MTPNSTKFRVKVEGRYCVYTHTPPGKDRPIWLGYGPLASAFDVGGLAVPRQVANYFQDDVEVTILDWADDWSKVELRAQRWVERIKPDASSLENDNRHKPVKCVETGTVYESVGAAASAAGLSYRSMNRALTEGRAAGPQKHHWKYA